MEGARKFEMSINGRMSLSRRVRSSRPIPRRGQVKVAIVVGLAHSFASIFSFSAQMAAGARRTGMRDGDLSKKLRWRPIPLRGQVKVGIVLGLAHTLAAISSFRTSH
ncbi:hypothetical protein RJ640_030174 [Escallonia rubra]|uniref:Uncharacterized protein n=1 Tax=Escallonia rubra TaxID=112253 RepID=A0AA88R411_9ASTE|nr:hypothetical protein RJ640_030174 [Escallonia rubra]